MRYGCPSLPGNPDVSVLECSGNIGYIEDRLPRIALPGNHVFIPVCEGGWKIGEPRSAQPQPQQVTLALWLWPVLVIRSRVQDDVVADELHVTGLERHIEMVLRIIANAIHELESLALQVCQARHIGKPLSRLNIAAVIANEEPALVMTKARSLVVGKLSRVFLASPIDTERLAHDLPEIRALSKKPVVHGGGTDDARQSPRLRCRQAKQA